MMSRQPHTLDQRQSSFGSKSDPQENGCILWRGCLDGYGYGLFRVAPGKVERAHRVALRWSGTPVGPDDVVMHKCDTPACVNPEHLSIGTRPLNNADRDQKGRHWAQQGIEHTRAKLTEAQVYEIRSSSASLDALAAVYPVSKQTICKIRQRKIWKHLP